MAEYIEREALIQTIQKDPWIGAQGKDYALCDIAEQPTADVVEVRHGYWFITEYEYFTCSECGNSYYNGCESTAEAKAHKEFAENVSKLICDNTYPDFDKDGKAVNIWNAKDGYKQIDNLLKEMVGDNDE